MTEINYLYFHHRQDICRARDKCDTLGKCIFVLFFLFVCFNRVMQIIVEMYIK